MHRFYCPDLSVPIADGQALSARAQLDREQTYHARKVLRMQVGDRLELFNGQGLEAAGQIVGDAKDLCFQVHVTTSRYTDADRPAVDLAVSVPKGQRADQMVEQASQLGASRLIPLRAERSVVEPREAKMSRFERIAVESAKQCRRAHLLQVAKPTSLEALLEDDYDVTLLAMPDGDGSRPIADAVRSAGRVLVLIGPEGGFTDLEVHIALTSGALRWKIGPHTLRIETAAAAALSIVRYLARR